MRPFCGRCVAVRRGRTERDAPPRVHRGRTGRDALRRVRSQFTFNHAGERPHPLSRDRRCAWTQCRCQRVETDTLPRQIRDKKVVLDQRNAPVDDGPVRDFKCAGEINPTFHVRLDGELISCINETMSISSDPSRPSGMVRLREIALDSECLFELLEEGELLALVECQGLQHALGDGSSSHAPATSSSLRCARKKA